MVSTPRTQPVAPALGSQVSATAVLDASAQGQAVVDAARKVRYINRTGAGILGLAPAAVLGRVLSELMAPDDPGGEGERTRTAVLARPDGDRILGYTITAIDESDPGLRLVTFWDVTASRQQARHFRAYARTASSLTGATSVSDVLALIAREAQNATDMLGVMAMLIDGTTSRMLAVGTAGRFPDDFIERWQVTYDRGAPMISLRTMRERRPIVANGLRHVVGHDKRFDALAMIAGTGDWDTSVLAPMAVRGEVIGVLAGMYREGHGPTESDIAFLTAMADQAGVVIDNARLVAEYQANAALEERHRLARELHDSVSDSLFSLTLQACAVERLYEAGEAADERVTRGLREIHSLTQSALAEMRALVLQVRSGGPHQAGLVTALKEHAEALSSRAGLTVSVAATSDWPDISESLATDVFRIVQEALQNVVKHAGASLVVVDMECPRQQPNALHVRVKDDGAGFDPSAAFDGHLGLITMRERAERHGGSLAISSRPGLTEVSVAIPDVRADPRSGCGPG
jgi:signal transduction histidine kinase